MIIDSHQHFWNYEPQKHGWIDEDMKTIRRDFLPDELEAIFREQGVAGSVAVEADQNEAETEFLIALSNKYSFIKGIVGYTDLRADNVEERLAYFNGYPVVKGFRHVLQSQDPSFLLQPSFLRGIGLLKKYGFTYDILVFPKHLAAVKQLVAGFPDQLFVLDHLAKPYIKHGQIDEWAADIRELARYSNLYCKLSGMVTEADYLHWKQPDFTAYLDVVVNAFGTNRLLYGSDWPVCTVAASYGQVSAIIKDYFATFSPEEQEAVFSGNATRFYHL
ncbi:MAG: amidohydrolase family protein [Chitinophagales bacterium]|nr:amidohydrolase family protein [Chitinophagales bacterium]